MSKKKLQPMKIEDLPPLVCGDCQACCKSDAIFLLPEEIGKYETEMIYGRQAIAHKPNGDCFYLTPGGCGIHALKPAKCRTMDCRALLLKVGLSKFMAFPISNEVKAAGMEKLEEALK